LLLIDEDYDELQTQLYDRIQDSPDATYFPELLSWVFVQRKDYKNALRQVKALDNKLEENGGRVFRLAEIASNAKDYDTAIAAYDYIISDKGKTSTYYIEAKRESLTCKRNRLVEGYEYTELEITLLDEMIQFPHLNPNVQARGKISLADFYLMQGERWESTLLYSQVDKKYKDDILGHEARFRNAKLSYYAGDFQWAQTQFDVLKASTSKLIANDALDLSIFIMDNLGLDSVAAPMELYAESDLLVFQNRFDEAFLKLDTIQGSFPEHSLDDDIYYLKSKVYIKQRDYAMAVQMLDAS